MTVLKSKKIKLFALATGAGLLCAAAFACREYVVRHAPPVFKGNFFQLTIDLDYKGKPFTISYPVGCNFSVTRNIDGDRSVDGGSTVPFLFGKKTPDGGALVVYTPKMCEFSKQIDEGKIPSSYNPFVIHFADADKPWFGMGYWGIEAYDSPLSVMKFKGSHIERITGQDWIAWRDANPDANWVTWKKMNLSPNWFEDHRWLPGDKFMPTVCNGALVTRLPEVVREEVKKFWPLEHPLFWIDSEASMTVARMSGSRREHYQDPSKTILFEGHPSWAYDGMPLSPKMTMYLAETDFSMNDRLPNGTTDSKKLRPTPGNPYWNKTPVKTVNVITRMNIVLDSEHKGFMYCNDTDVGRTNWNDHKKAFDGIGGIYQLNGQNIVGPSFHPDYSLQSSAFMNDEFAIYSRNFVLFMKGGGL